MSGGGNCICAGRSRRGGNLGATSKLAMTRHPSTRYTDARTADANPIDEIRLLSMMGNATPPTELPAMTTPIAKERLRANQCDITEVAVKMPSVFVRYCGDSLANLGGKEVPFLDQLRHLEPKTPGRTGSW